MLWIDYYFYLMELPTEERKCQIILMLTFWLIMLLIGFICDIIKGKKELVK